MTDGDAAIASQMETGSLSPTDRIAGYNKLLCIEEKPGESAQYPGKDVVFSIRKQGNTVQSRTSA